MIATVGISERDSPAARLGLTTDAVALDRTGTAEY